MGAVKIRKIKTEEEFNMAVEAAKADNDNMHFPTHILWRDDEIIGAWSLASIPLVLVWSDSKKLKKEDSIMYSEMIDSMMDDRGEKHHFVCCNSNSPYYEHMEKFGYKTVWNTNVFYKNYKLKRKK